MTELVSESNTGVVVVDQRTRLLLHQVLVVGCGNFSNAVAMHMAYQGARVQVVVPFESQPVTELSRPLGGSVVQVVADLSQQPGRDDLYAERSKTDILVIRLFRDTKPWAVTLAEEIARRMAEGKGGRVIVLADQGQQQAGNQLINRLVQSHGYKGVIANVVMLDNFVGVGDAVAAKMPGRRLGQPSDVADIVGYLAAATPYLNGATIMLDGGRARSAR
ncbi:MAG: Enoyl-(Acyl carrier protein) reductase [Candidatus Saccharibacteria bacterium]|nr:Enoyl-(Acyl carrier protein) reductase [Candidatus Saccharibacteria bacterium]